MNLFNEISRTNAAYCRSLGLDSDTYDRQLSDAESNGTPLSPEETEIAVLMGKGINRQAAEMFAALNHMPPSPVTKLPVLATPHCIVEYATRRSLWDQKDIRPYYDDCRERSGQRAGVWVGD